MSGVPLERDDNYFVYSFYCNSRAELSIPGIAQMLQESAWLHAESCNVGYHDLKKEDLLWVLSALKIRIFDIPRWGSHIRLNTWGRKYDALFAYRDYEIFDSETNEKMIQASSSWLVIDINSRKPKRITEDIHKIIPVDRSCFSTNPGKFRSPEKYDSQRKYTVLYSDLDVYKHVNNTRYIQWCIDSLQEYHANKIKIDGIELRFISEAHLGDHVMINYKKEGEAYYLSGMQENNGKEIFRAEISYKSL